MEYIIEYTAWDYARFALGATLFALAICRLIAITVGFSIGIYKTIMRKRYA